MNIAASTRISCGLLLTLITISEAAAEVTVGDRSVSCAEDPACINRLHPEIPEEGDIWRTEKASYSSGAMLST